ncbi:MAG: ExeA family protein [Candidatus Acidiferrales bacterium]
MYQSFFKLNRSPFEISPDPGFLYTTGQHQEAVAGLRYGVLSRKGFMVLTGEVGTGKTLVIRCLLDRLEKDRVAYAYVFNSLLTSQELMFYVAEDLGIRGNSGSKADVLLKLGRYFIDRHQKGLTTMLIIEEAQHLNSRALEEIRMLTNLETPQGKSLQVILIGQPELEATLQTNALRQLRQRIALWFRLRPLAEAEVYAYVECRLKLAGSEKEGVFDPAALRRVYYFSQGIPRLINTLCDHAMISAYALGHEQVTADLIDDAASDLGMRPVNAQAAVSVPSIEPRTTGISRSLPTDLLGIRTNFFLHEGIK